MCFNIDVLTHLFFHCGSNVWDSTQGWTNECLKLEFGTHQERSNVSSIFTGSIVCACLWERGCARLWWSGEVGGEVEKRSVCVGVLHLNDNC